MSGTPVHGTVETGFEQVYDAFERSFETREYHGGTFGYLIGEVLVNSRSGAPPGTEQQPAVRRPAS